MLAEVQLQAVQAVLRCFEKDVQQCLDACPRSLRVRANMAPDEEDGKQRKAEERKAKQHKAAAAVATAVPVATAVGAATQVTMMVMLVMASSQRNNLLLTTAASRRPPAAAAALFSGTMQPVASRQMSAVRRRLGKD